MENTNLKIHCEVSGLAYRYGRNSLFRNLNASLWPGRIHLITGPNGAGKSTLLRLLASALEAEQGSIRYLKGETALQQEEVRNQISFSAPYQELPEEFSLAELISLQIRFTGAGPGNDSFYHQLAELFGLLPALEKPVNAYSTGMKQKAKFILALGMDRPVWLLDEPGANLDTESSKVLYRLLKDNMHDRLIVLASNDPAEIALGELAVHL